MQNKIIGVALSALVITCVAQSHSKFDGGYVGVGAGYQATKMTGKADGAFRTAIIAAAGAAALESKTVSPKGFDLSVHAGYGEMMDSIYVGGDARFAYNFGKKSTAMTDAAAPAATVEVKTGWKTGLGALVGTEVMDDCLVYFRLGLDYSKMKIKTTNAQAFNTNKSTTVWYVTPGVGIMKALDQDWKINASYEYGHAISAKKISNRIAFDKKPTTHAVKVGVSYFL